jgi:hypothetical protein
MLRSLPAYCSPLLLTSVFPREKISALDRRYTAVIQALDHLVDAVELKAA